MISNGVIFRLTDLPYVSPIYQNNKAPIGLAKNPMAKTENAFNKAVSIDEEGKYRVAIKGAKNP